MFNMEWISKIKLQYYLRNILLKYDIVLKRIRFDLFLKTVFHSVGAVYNCIVMVIGVIIVDGITEEQMKSELVRDTKIYMNFYATNWNYVSNYFYCALFVFF